MELYHSIHSCLLFTRPLYLSSNIHSAILHLFSSAPQGLKPIHMSLFFMWWINMKYERWWGSILAEFMILKWQRSLAVWVLQRIWMSSWPVILMRFFHQSTTPGLATARAFTAIYLTERRLLCVVLSVFSPLQFSVTHFVMLILVVSLSNCVQRQTELRASTFSHICTFVWSCQTMESSHLFKQNQCEIRTIPWGLSWTTQILWKV